MEFFSKAWDVVQTVATSITSITIESKVDGSQIGTWNSDTISAGCSLISVNDSGTALRLSADYHGTPEIHKMHDKGFLLTIKIRASQYSRSDRIELALCHDRGTGRVCLKPLPNDASSSSSSETVEIKKYFQWLPVNVITRPGVLMLKNLGSGQCLENMGVGSQVRLCPQDMENKAQWWVINDFASTMQRTQRAMSGLSYDDDDD